MRKFQTLILMILVGGAAMAAVASEATGEHPSDEHHTLPAYPEEVGELGPLVITNSMVVTMVVAAILIFSAQYATRAVRLVPEGTQNFWEWLVETLYDFLAGIVGKDLIRNTFWFFATIFIFILATNWFGLIPGVGTVGWEYATEEGTVFKPWLRGGHADLNMTAAMSTCFFFLWFYWAYRANGIRGMWRHIFGNKGGGRGFMRLFMIVVFFFVGLLEMVSILFRPVALSFRLYGNIFAGENILEAMLGIVPWLGWIIPLPFYFLEMLVGFVQAVVFTLLTAVFTFLICHHPEGEESH